MNKKNTLLVIIITVVISLVANVFFGRFLSAKLSTWPLLNKWHLLNPQAPIVINNQQIVHTSESDDISGAAATAKSKLSSLLATTKDTHQVSHVGSAINLTSDGVFVTGASILTNPNSDYSIVLEDGRTASITQVTPDSATGLTFLRATLSNVPTAILDDSSSLLVGDKIVFLSNSGQQFQTRALASMVSSSENDVEGVLYLSDQPSRSFGAQQTGPFDSGEAAVDLKGNVVGIWNSSAVLVSSDVLQQELSLYLANSQKISHPSFGFSYTMVTKTDSLLSGLPEGALIKSGVQNSGFTATSTLETGDIITKIGNNTVDEDHPLEPYLANYKTGDTVSFTVVRNKKELPVTLVVR